MIPIRQAAELSPVPNSSTGCGAGSCPPRPVDVLAKVLDVLVEYVEIALRLGIPASLALVEVFAASLRHSRSMDSQLART